MDFELATGIALPGSAKRLAGSDGKRTRRGAAHVIQSVFDPPSPTESSLQHDIHKVDVPKQQPRYSCKVCGRSGLWADRTKFLSLSCAGHPETTAQAVRRHRLASQRLKLSQQAAQDSSAPPLGERAVFFADNFRSSLAKNQPRCIPITDDATWVCRLFSGFSLPPSAGLLRRPILLAQPRVLTEICLASDQILGNALPAASHWHANWYPSYDALDARPRPLWRPREPDEAFLLPVRCREFRLSPRPYHKASHEA